MAECIHNEFTAFVAREQAHSRGVPLQRSIRSFRPPPSELTLQQRRDKIAIAKKNSTCRNCHKPGHWAAECPEKKHHPHGKPKPFKKKLRGHLSVVETDSDESSDEVLAHVAVSSTVPVLRKDVAPTSK